MGREVGASPSALREFLFFSHNSKLTFPYLPHDLHPIPKNFHVHRESTIGVSHEVEIREFSLGKRKKMVIQPRHMKMTFQFSIYS